MQHLQYLSTESKKNLTNKEMIMVIPNCSKQQKGSIFKTWLRKGSRCEQVHVIKVCQSLGEPYESSFSMEGNLMIIVSPSKLRTRWMIWVKTTNCGFLIPNFLSLKTLAAGEKTANVTYSTQRPFTALLFSQGRDSWQKVMRVCCFPFSQGNCITSFCGVQYRLTWK